jgi:hypothetical protein
VGCVRRYLRTLGASNRAYLRHDALEHRGYLGAGLFRPPWWEMGWVQGAE